PHIVREIAYRKWLNASAANSALRPSKRLLWFIRTIKRELHLDTRHVSLVFDSRALTSANRGTRVAGISVLPHSLASPGSAGPDPIFERQEPPPMLPATLPQTVRRYCLCITVTLAAVACANAQVPVAANTPPPAQIQKQALAGIDKLQSWYAQSTGLYQTTGWWNSANALTMLADYLLVARTASYTTVFSNSFQQAQKTNSGFLNNYYDDEGWWALAWIAAYDLTRTQQY